MYDERYEKVDAFVDAMNESASRVGDSSIYLFNKFRSGMGIMFVTVTTVAIGFIVGEFIRRFDLGPIFGVDVYWISVVIGSALGGYIAYWAEEAKIATIKGAVFSEGSNRIFQLLAGSAVIAVLVLINANGVQKIADFSLRYMDRELQNSYILKAKEKRVEAHAKTATEENIKADDSSKKMLLASRESLMNAKNTEIEAVRSKFKAWVKGRDPHAYRTMIANKKAEMAKKISKIEDRYEKKFANIDWKIAQAEKRANEKIAAIRKLKAEEREKADKSEKELEAYYTRESEKNKGTVEQYKGIGMIVAISGEVIDGILALLLFILVKSNPNTNGTPQVDRNTRALRARIVAPARKVHTVTGASHTSPKYKAHPKSRAGRNLIEEIGRVALSLAIERDEYIDGYLNHPTQREIIKAFAEQGRSVTPLEIQQYFKSKEDELIFINQKVGFAYANRSKEVA